MSRRKQKQPKHAQQEYEGMGTDEVSYEGDMKMTEHQTNKNQRVMPSEGHNESVKRDAHTWSSAFCNGVVDQANGELPERTNRSEQPFIDLVSKEQREAFHEYLEDEGQQRDDRNNKSNIDEFQTKHSGPSKQASDEVRKQPPERTGCPSELTCMACGLYFFNQQTYETHVEKYCIALKYLMKNKALEETYLAVHGNDQRKTYKDNIDIQHPTLEKLKNAFYRIQQSLIMSRNSQLKDVSASLRASQSGRNNTKELLSTATESGQYRSDARTPDPPDGTREGKGNESDTNSRNRDYRNDVNGGFQSPDPVDKTARPAVSTCVVCDEHFPNDSALRGHVLTKHGSNANVLSSPNSKSSMRFHRNHSKLTKSRRFSTVDRPALSLLTGRNMKPLPGMAEEESSVHSPKESDAISVTDAPGSSHSSRPNSRGNPSVNAKLERGDAPPPQFAVKHFHDDDRRVSCPAVPGVNIALDSFPFLADNEEQKHCTECDIKFNSIANYRAHKKFYCAGRHEQRNGEVNQYRTGSLQLPDNPQAYPDFHRQPTRNFNSRSSLPSRKRSHFVPLSSPADCNNEDVAGEEPRPKKSDSKSPSIVGQSSQNENEAAQQKRYYCEECKISFSKEDTFIAHKKYYCHTRRKDRTSTRIAGSRTSVRSSSRDSSEGLPAYDRATAYNPFAMNENLWRIRDSERSASLGSMFPGDNLFANAGCNISQLLQQQSLVMGNLAMMHPYLMKQYLALKDKFPPDMYGANNSPNPYFTAFSNTRKLSADESRLRTHEGYSSTPDLSMKSNRRPARQSCAAAICVKQEDNNWDENRSGYFREKDKESPGPGFALDLRRNTPCSSAEDEHGRPLSSAEVPTPQHAGQNSPPQKRADLESDTESQHRRVANSNSNDGAETSRAPSPKGRCQTCRSCNAQFNSLSTFIAHKKYYCSGITASLQSFSSSPVVVKSESDWGL